MESNPKIVVDFERQFDCKIVFDYFDNDSIVIPKLAGGGVSTYDIVCIGNHIVPAATMRCCLRVRSSIATTSQRRTGLPSIDSNGNTYIFFLGFAWNPSRYILTTTDGIRYTYDEAAGFLEARDRNDNALTATATGLRHSTGAAVSFVRVRAGPHHANQRARWRERGLRLQRGRRSYFHDRR